MSLLFFRNLIFIWKYVRSMFVSFKTERQIKGSPCLFVPNKSSGERRFGSCFCSTWASCGVFALDFYGKNPPLPASSLKWTYHPLVRYLMIRAYENHWFPGFPKKKKRPAIISNSPDSWSCSSSTWPNFMAVINRGYYCNYLLSGVFSKQKQVAVK